MKFDPSQLIGLAGNFMAGGNPQQLTDSPVATQNGGGLEEQPTNEVIGLIVKFLETLTPEELQKMIGILQIIEEKKEIIDQLGVYAKNLVKTE
jgi:hypothetical protein